MARVRLYLGKKQYNGYYEVPVDVCVRTFKLDLSSWSEHPSMLRFKETMDALKGATVQILEADLTHSSEAVSPNPALPPDLKEGYYRVHASAEKISAFCQKHGYQFVIAQWPD